MPWTISGTQPMDARILAYVHSIFGEVELASWCLMASADDAHQLHISIDFDRGRLPEIIAALTPRVQYLIGSMSEDRAKLRVEAELMININDLERE